MGENCVGDSMSKSNRKRVVVDSPESQQFDEESKFRLKYQSLLQDYLDLQKEFVSKKKKLQIEKQKRDVLLAEVRFLRKRHKQLMEIQSSDRQLEQHLVPGQNLSVHDQLVEKPWKMEEKPRSCLNKGKSVGKKKLSWQDQVWL